MFVAVVVGRLFQSAYCKIAERSYLFVIISDAGSAMDQAMAATLASIAVPDENRPVNNVSGKGSKSKSQTQEVPILKNKQELIEAFKELLKKKVQIKINNEHAF